MRFDDGGWASRSISWNLARFASDASFLGYDWSNICAGMGTVTMVSGCVGIFRRFLLHNKTTTRSDKERLAAERPAPR